MDVNKEAPNNPDEIQPFRNDEVLATNNSNNQPENSILLTQSSNRQQYVQNNGISPVPITNRGEVDSNKSTSSKFDKSAATVQIIGFLCGLLGIIFVGLLLGSILNGRLISNSNQTFGIIADYYFLTHAIPLAMIVFGVMALMTRNIIYLAYPLVGFYLGQPLVESDLVRYLAGNIPAQTPENQPLYFIYLVTVTISYATIYMTEKPLRTIFKEYRKHKLSNTTLLTSIGILAGCSLTVLACSFAASPLYTSQIRERSIIRVPNDEMFIGNTGSDYEITTPAAVIEKNKQRINIGSVKAKPLNKWWVNDIHEVCGDVITINFHPNQKAKNTYKTTPKGFQYAEAIFKSNATNPPKRTNEYKVIYNCFVLDNQKYYFERSELGGKDVLAKYETGAVIDAIISGVRFVPGCYGEKIKYLRQCAESDSKAIEILNQSIHKANSVNLPRAIEQPKTLLNPDAYVKVDQLKIAEWGIIIPLSEETKDAYYSIGTAEGASKDMLTIALRSVDGKDCYAGKRGDVTGRGIAYAIRKMTDDGKYDYKVYSNANAKSCLSAVAKDVNVLEDVFVWANANITR